MLKINVDFTRDHVRAVVFGPLDKGEQRVILLVPHQEAKA